jgi:hypothetical protein
MPEMTKTPMIAQDRTPLLLRALLLLFAGALRRLRVAVLAICPNPVLGRIIAAQSFPKGWRGDLK